MKDYARGFYKGKEWKQCRAAYTKAARGLCEHCLSRGIIKAGKIVHHKIHIDPDNIQDPTITLDFNNLELVCMDCHAELHKGERARRYKLDELGRVSVK